MGCRIWFTKENTSGLTPSDLSIINRAARNLFDVKELSPTHARLAEIRCSYKPGMSARDLIDLIDPRL